MEIDTNNIPPSVYTLDGRDYPNQYRLSFCIDAPAQDFWFEGNNIVTGPPQILQRQVRHGRWLPLQLSREFVVTSSNQNGEYGHADPLVTVGQRATVVLVPRLGAMAITVSDRQPSAGFDDGPFNRGYEFNYESIVTGDQFQMGESIWHLRTRFNTDAPAGLRVSRLIKVVPE